MIAKRCLPLHRFAFRFITNPLLVIVRQTEVLRERMQRLLDLQAESVEVVSSKRKKTEELTVSRLLY